MRLDVLIPTYNREALLRRTLESFLAAEKPPDLDFGLTVVDNNSPDGTRRAVEEFQEKFGGRLNYLFEGRQGKSHALNSGVAATTGDLVGIIDDDEEVDARWLVCVRDVFRDPEVDFIGGPYVPRWDMTPPAWLPEDYPAVIGKVDGGSEVVPYGAEFPGILMGGNAVITRAALEKAGPFSTALCRIGTGLLMGEDDLMYARLLETGARGFYRPDLIIHHYVIPERIDKRYFRRWCFWRGVSAGIIDRDTPQPVPYFAGAPRYLCGRVARNLLRMVKGRLAGGRTPAQLFSDELAAWDLAGFFYGKHRYWTKVAGDHGGAAGLKAEGAS